MSSLKHESADLKVFINKTKEEVNTNREDMVVKFNEKISKVKDICA